MPWDELQFTLGVDYLDRDYLELLPVFGATLKPAPWLRCDVLFPKPRFALRIAPETWVYVAGELGGGQWGIERVDRSPDVVAYRDYRLLLGVTTGTDSEGAKSMSFLEIGYVFDRRLEYRSGTNYKPLPMPRS